MTKTVIATAVEEMASDNEAVQISKKEKQREFKERSDLKDIELIEKGEKVYGRKR